jgi:DNA topoisomerase IB
MKTINEETDIEFEDPAGFFNYGGNDYPYWGNPAGRNKTIDYDVGKFNRYAKMGAAADDLLNKFKHKVQTDYKSLDGRCAFASIIMMKYGMRIGNEDSAVGYESGLKDNVGEVVQTYGTTTLLNKHISFSEGGLVLDFLGKTQVKQHVTIDDPFITEHAKQYYNAGAPDRKWLNVDYDILFKFVKNEVGDAFIPKDFRTFCANVTGWSTIRSYLDKPKRSTRSEANEEIKSVVESCAARLGNTPGISKRSYLDSRMLDWFKHERLEEGD